MTTCDFAAESGDASEKGLAVRAAPDATAQVLGYIATSGDKQEDSAEGTTQGHGFRVLGAMDGWFRIEGAIYANPESPASLDEKGWVDGRSVTVRLYRETLKAAPNDNAPDVVYLVGYDADGNSLYFPETVPVSRVFGCSGRRRAHLFLRAPSRQDATRFRHAPSRRNSRECGGASGNNSRRDPRL
jgi:hypothetical protein